MEYLSARQAADIIGMPYTTLVKHLNDGNINCQRMGPHFAITKEDLITFKLSYDRGEFTKKSGPQIREQARLEQIVREVREAVALRQQRLGGAS